MQENGVERVQTEWLEQLVEVEEQERAHIASFIHDDVLQLLGANMLKAQLCSRLFEMGRDAEAREELQVLQEDIAHTGDSLRRLMLEMQPLGGHEWGLEEQLAFYLQHLPGGENVTIGFKLGSEPFFEGWLGLAFYRLGRQSLALAGSSLVGRSGWVGFSAEDGKVSMVVILDGNGGRSATRGEDSCERHERYLVRRAAVWGIQATITGDDTIGWHCTYTAGC
jgi:signal transduction histidine kinase